MNIDLTPVQTLGLGLLGLSIVWIGAVMAAPFIFGEEMSERAKKQLRTSLAGAVLIGIGGTIASLFGG